MTRPDDIPVLSRENYDIWKIKMQVYLAAQNDDIWNVITEGPIKTLVTTPLEDDSQMMVNPLYEWTAVDKKKAKIDNMAKNILYKALDDSMFKRIKLCSSAKEIWEKLVQLCEGSEQNKENMKIAATQKLDSIRMYSYETLAEFDERFTCAVIELSSLGKTYTNREVVIKAMRALPKEWDMKIVAMKEAKDLNKMELHDFFFDLKAYEFEKNARKAEEEPSTKALVTAEQPPSPASTSARETEILSSQAVTSLAKMFGNLISHLPADCRKPRRNDKKPLNKNKKEDGRSFKEKKALVAVKGTWDDGESEGETIRCLVAERCIPKCSADDPVSKSSWADSDTEEENITCLSADDQVFDFSSNEFSKEELVDALNDMVIEYKKLADSLNENKLKSDSLNFSKQNDEINVLQNRVSELAAENVILKAAAQSTSIENKRLNYIFKSWTKSGNILQQLHGQQRPDGCKSGLGFVEKNPEEPKTKLFKNKTFFVKKGAADETADIHADQTSQNEKESDTVNYVQPADSMSSWLKPMKPKKIRCPVLETGQTSRRLPSQKYFSKIKKSLAGGIADRQKRFKTLKMLNGRSIRIIQVWIPKGLMNLGPN